MSFIAEHPQTSGMLKRPDGEMHYLIDDFSDPWTTPETVIMLHGIAETAAMWRPFVPQLARHYRVVRVDLRGFGASSALPEGKDFGLADWADDIAALVSHLRADHVHLVATKLGALVAFEVAQRRPAWIASLSLPGMLASPAGSLGAWVEDWVGLVETGGAREWARVTMPGRMADNLTPEAYQWWIELMGAAPAATVIHCFRMLPAIPEAPHPERVQCPTLFLAAAGEGYISGTYDQRPAAADIARLQQKVPGAVLGLIPANSYHIAATHPDQCAAKILEFIKGATRHACSKETERVVAQ